MTPYGVTGSERVNWMKHGIDLKLVIKCSYEFIFTLVQGRSSGLWNHYLPPWKTVANPKPSYGQWRYGRALLEDNRWATLWTVQYTQREWVAEETTEMGNLHDRDLFPPWPPLGTRACVCPPGDFSGQSLRRFLPFYLPVISPWSRGCRLPSTDPLLSP